MAESNEPCQPCAGSGKVRMIFDIVPGRMPPEPMDIDCPKCAGTGYHTPPRFPPRRAEERRSDFVVDLEAMERRINEMR